MKKTIIISVSITILLIGLSFFLILTKDQIEPILPPTPPVHPPAETIPPPDIDITSRITNQVLEEVNRFSGHIQEFQYSEGSPEDTGYVMELIDAFENPPGDIITDEVIGIDIKNKCYSQTLRDITYCEQVTDLYRRATCVEMHHMMTAIEEKDSKYCINIGTHKTSHWCWAFLDENYTICEDPNMENIVFKKTCVALANRDITHCDGIELSCYLVYYEFMALYENDASWCEYIQEPGDREICKAIVNLDHSYCTDAFSS